MESNYKNINFDEFRPLLDSMVRAIEVYKAENETEKKSDSNE